MVIKSLKLLSLESNIHVQCVCHSLTGSVSYNNIICMHILGSDCLTGKIFQVAMFCTYNATIVHILSVECYIVNLHCYVIKCAQSMPNMYLYT